jgi:hypothetical protein
MEQGRQTMAYIGNTYFATRIETDEQGNIWQIVNHEDEWIIEDLQAAADGECIMEVGISPEDYYEGFEMDDGF